MSDATAPTVKISDKETDEKSEKQSHSDVLITAVEEQSTVVKRLI